jgi:DNA-directed RNA polymerase specialized sigma subunit
VDSKTPNSTPYILTVAQGREFLLKKAQENKMSLLEYIQNRPMRDKAIRELRKYSTLSLREIAEACGSISESTVSRILRN